MPLYNPPAPSSGTGTSSGGLTLASKVVGPITALARAGTILPVDTSAGAVTVQLPTGTGVTVPIVVKLISKATYACMILAAGAETIDDSTTGLMLATDYEWVQLIPDGGTNWLQIG